MHGVGFMQELAEDGRVLIKKGEWVDGKNVRWIEDQAFFERQKTATSSQIEVPIPARANKNSDDQDNQIYKVHLRYDIIETDIRVLHKDDQLNI